MNRRLVQEMKSVRHLLVLTVGLGLAAGFLIIEQAMLLTRVVNDVFLGKQGMTAVWPFLFTLFALVATRGLLGWLSETTALRMAIQIKAELRLRLVRQLFRLGPAFLRQEHSGELVNTAFEGVEQLEPYLARYLPQVSLSALIPSAILAVIFGKDVLSGVIFTVTAPIIVLFMILIGKTAQSVTDKQWRTMSVLSAHFFDVLRGLTTLKLFNRSRAQMAVIARISDDYRKTTMRTLRVAFLSSFALELMATLGTALVAVSIGLRLLSGQLSFADGLVVLLLAPEFYAPIRALGAQFHASINGVTAANRILDILATQPMGLEDKPDGKVLADVPLSIEFTHVTFRYPRPRIEEDRSDRHALTDVSFRIACGETVAIVGSSGAGKSTVINLALGFLRPESGLLSLNEVPFDHLSMSWWRDQVAYVPQTTHFLHGTIADNLRLARPTCSAAEIEDACRLAGAEAFIRELPQGYDTLVGEGGTGLSGGQAQRLAIARAFLKDSPILIFDEPTAHLDVESELGIRTALERLLQSRTALIVAHRLRTVIGADRILVLDGGRIVGQGRHVDLLRAHPLYQRLFAAYAGVEVSPLKGAWP
ncbi:MAG: thiol reductant ABC exporter subunit CydD [Bacilli bacterium]